MHVEEPSTLHLVLVSNMRETENLQTCPKNKVQGFYVGMHAAHSNPCPIFLGMATWLEPLIRHSPKLGRKSSFSLVFVPESMLREG